MCCEPTNSRLPRIFSSWVHTELAQDPAVVISRPLRSLD